MGFLSGMVARDTTEAVTTNEEKRALGVGSTAWLLNALQGVTTSPSGIAVTPEGSLKYSAVLACVRVLAEGLASLPCLVYERFRMNGRDAKRRAPSHPAYDLLHNRPNEVITAFEMYEMGMAQVLLWGNFYAEIAWDGRGQVAELWPLPAWRMEPKVMRRGKTFELWLDNEAPKTFADYQILHIPGFGYDGVKGKSMVALAREAVGLGIATQRFGSAFFGNGARPGGVLEHPGQLSDEAHKRLRESWSDAHEGLERAQRLAILEEGMRYSQIAVPPEDAQFLETRKFQRSEIASIFRVPPHMIGDLERATFSNIEQQSLDFYRNTLQPWLRRWEQRLMRSLLVGRERETHFVEFLVDALLRADTAARYEAYATGRQWGWLSTNDIRARENMNPVDGGDEYLVPLNMIPAGAVGLLPEGAGPPEPEEGERGATHQEQERRTGVPGTEARSLQSAVVRHRLMRAYYPLFEDVAARVTRREQNDVRNAARRLLSKDDVNGFLLWLEDFARDHEEFTARNFRPLYRSYGSAVAPVVYEELGEERGKGEEGATHQGQVRGTKEIPEELEGFVEAYVEEFARRNVAVSRARLREIVEEALAEGEDPLEALEAALEQWPDARAAEVGHYEPDRFNNAVAKAIYATVGVTTLVWRAFGESCPYCSALNGKVVGIREHFLPAGDFQPEGAERPLNVMHDIGHAPAHRGCDCMVTAGVG